MITNIRFHIVEPITISYKRPFRDVVIEWVNGHARLVPKRKDR